VFKTEAEVRDHAKSRDPCDIVQANRDGFDLDQKKKLKARSKQPEMEKWKEMYIILFPGVPVSNIPTPCKLLQVANSDTPLIFLQFTTRQALGNIKL
jgi:hypothetical protein